MNYLCLDYGTRRIGVAIATTPIAEPLEVIPNSTKTSSEVVSSYALERIQALLKQYAIDTIIVGISEEAMAAKTRHFIETLQKHTTLPIEEMDETLSTYQAVEQMKSMKKSKREGERDHYAAANILQSYVDLQGVSLV